MTDNDFFKEAYQYKDKLLKIASIKLGNAFDAEDAVEDVIMRGYEKQSQLRNKEKIYPWLKRILINYCNDMFRIANKFDPSDNFDNFSSDNSNPEDQNVQIAKLEQILDAMLTIEPEEYAEALILFYYRRFDYDKIAEETGTPVGTVKSRLSRARESLARVLKDEGMNAKDIETISRLSEWPEIRFR